MLTRIAMIDFYVLTYADVCRFNYRQLLTRIAIVDFYVLTYADVC